MATYRPMPVMEAESQGRPFLALAAACGVFLTTFTLANAAFQGTAPTTTQLFTTTRPATTAAPAMVGWSTQIRMNRMALAAGMETDKKTGQYKDIDGQGNVFAIEPKMAVEKSGDEAAGSRLVLGAIVGIVALVVAAGGLGKLSDFRPTSTLSYKGPPLSEISAQIQREI